MAAVGRSYPLWRAGIASSVSRRILALVIVAGLSVALTAPVDASAKGTNAARLEHFRHDRWIQEDGAPSGLDAMAQTPDGYLWLGARDGLWRFDGATFERIDPSSGSPMKDAPVASLHVDHRGWLWIGYGESAGVAVYRNGRLYDAKLSHAPPVISDITSTPDGSTWAQWGGISSRLWRLSHGRWHLVDSSMGLPAGYIMKLLATRRGELWLAVMNPGQSAAGVAYLPVRASRFRLLGGKFDFPGLAEDPGGRIWVTDRRGTGPLNEANLPSTGKRLYPAAPEIRLPDLTFDRWAGAWGATQANGVFRISSVRDPGMQPGSQVERFTNRDGLSSDITKRTLADRQGNVWASTDGGLDRFRYVDVVAASPVPSDPKAGIRLAMTNKGLLYVTSRNTLYRIDKDGNAAIRLRGANAETICGAGGPSIWLIQRKRVLKITPEGQGAAFAPPSELTLDCSQDDVGRLWIITGDRAAWWHDARGWHQAAKAVTPTIGSGIASWRNGAAWALGGSMIAVMQGNRLSRINLARHGLGDIASVNAVRDGYMISMARGVVRLHGDSIQALQGSRYPFANGLRAIVETPSGETWLYGSAGLTRVSTAELHRAFAGRTGSVEQRLFDYRDGLTGGLQRRGFVGTQAVLAEGGRLWFTTAVGLARLDTAALTDRGPPPPAFVRSVAAGGSSYRDPKALVLSPGTKSVRIVYSAISLSSPERLRFRYRLSGVDTEWADPGTRRGTNYTNLGPGQYRFQVIAGDDSGAWNNHPGVLDFRIEPTFVQGTPFRILCVAAVLALLWLIYRLRILAVASQVRARMAERHDERERIARELHDTLLQSVHGLMLRLQHIAESVPSELPIRRGLEETIERAQDVIVEGRDRVSALRPAGSSLDVELIFANLTSSLSAEWTAAFNIRANGQARSLTEMAAGEIAGIATEAMTNIARHSAASRVVVAITYSVKALLIEIRDDGVGFPDGVLRDGSRTGHYGMIGMRERAHRLGGNLVFDNGTEGGAALMLIVPAKSAFVRRPSSLADVYRKIARVLLPKPFRIPGKHRRGHT